MAAPTAMCNIETLNGREYKVKDMAMADFGCVRRRAR
jgi:adenosylhomocysteinase